MANKDTTTRQAHLSSNASGLLAENTAADFLIRHGLSLCTRNYRCKGGEIDIIAKDKDTIVFVEVRFRQHAQYGGAAASITLAKQQKIILAANHYLTIQQNHSASCRFDCILISNLNPLKIEWIKNAFACE